MKRTIIFIITALAIMECKAQSVLMPEMESAVMNEKREAVEAQARFVQIKEAVVKNLVSPPNKRCFTQLLLKRKRTNERNFEYHRFLSNFGFTKHCLKWYVIPRTRSN